MDMLDQLYEMYTMSSTALRKALSKMTVRDLQYFSQEIFAPRAYVKEELVSSIMVRLNQVDILKRSHAC